MSGGSSLMSQIDSLKNCISTQNVPRAVRVTEDICQYFADELSAAEKDLAIHKVFNISTGLLAFLSRTQRNQKLFSNVNIKILALLKTLIDEQRPNKLSDYAKDTVEICLRYATSSMVSAKEKELAINVLQALITNNLCGQVNVSEMVTILVDQVFNYKKHPGRFLQNTYELVGMIARDYPDQIPDGYDLRIRNAYFHSLETILLNQEEFTFSALTGALQGFTHFLNNFAPSTTSEPMICQRLYACIKKLSDPGEIRDHTTFRASINLLTVHGTLFSTQLLQDHQYWHNILLKWLYFPSWEDRTAGIYAMTTFHRELAAQIESRSEPNDIPILQFYINFFHTTMKSQTARSYEVRIAIRGFGLMGGACKKLLPAQTLDDLLTLVMQRTEYAAAQKRTHKDLLEHYPDFVQALSQIMSHIDALTSLQISSLQNIIIALIKDFHYLSKVHHQLVVRSLMQTFFNLSRVGGTVLDDVLETVTLQGIIWTCSHKLVYDSLEVWPIVDWKDNITYRSFVPLWSGLLADAESADYDRPHLKRMLFKHFIGTLFTILYKLNLSTRKRIFKDAAGNDQELYFCDPNYDLVPVQPKDFQIFFNIVEFYRDILATQASASLQETFPPWTQRFCETMMLKSVRHPLISGFLKLLSIGLSIAGQLQYFDGDTIEDDPFYGQVKYFLKTIIGRTQQTAGELQVAGLELLLKAPLPFHVEYLSNMLPVLVIAFDIGHSMMYIANMALTAVIRLSSGSTGQRVLDTQRTKLLETVLPCLELYLQSREHGDGQISVEMVRTTHRRKQQPQRRRATRTFRNDASGETDGSELQQLQSRIVMYLGKLEPTDCQAFVASPIGASKPNLVKLDTEQHLRLKLQYRDMKPTIYLDTLITRICTLATASAKRSTKIAACELVHAAILYLIGTKNHAGGVWSELCDRMLHLACDADVAVQQMFEPLLIQTIHYMSHPFQLFGAGIETLVDCLMTGISHRTNTSVRDMAARGLRELTSWALRQNVSRQQFDVSPASVNLLLDKLKLYSVDSDANRRRGAALAFNNLYRVLREDERYIDRHWFSLLHTFALNFVLTEELTTAAVAAAGDLGHLEEVTQSLTHIVRVLYERRDLFNEHKSYRCVPFTLSAANCEDADDKTLKTAVLWLLEQCASKNENYRRKCMEMFMKLAPYVVEYNSAKTFVNGTQTLNQLLRICEGLPADEDGTGILARPNLRHLKSSKQSAIVALCTWLQYVLAAIDNHSWLCGTGIVDRPQLLLDNSNIFEVIQFYLISVCNKEVLEILTSDSTISDNDTLNYPVDLESVHRFEWLKCMINIGIVDFLTNMLPLNGTVIRLPSTFLSQSSVAAISDLLICLVFSPQTLGFDAMCNERLCQDLSTRLERFFATTQSFWPTELRLKFIDQLADNMMYRLRTTVDSAEATLHSETIDIKQINSVNGLTMMCKKLATFQLSTVVAAMATQCSTALLLNLFEGVRERKFDAWHPVYLTPKVKTYANQLIGLCFLFPATQINELIQLLLRCTPLVQFSSNGGDQVTTVMHGEHFLDTFRRPIFEFIMCHSDVIIERFVERLTPENVTYIARILISLTDFLYKCRRHDTVCVRAIVRSLLQQWPTILEKARIQRIDDILVHQTSTFVLIELLSHTALICPFALSDIGRLTTGLSEWILSIISTELIPLELKSRCVFLLPCLIGPSDDSEPNVTDALQRLQRQYMPVLSREFVVGSLERSAFVNVFSLILDALIASKSPILLKFVIIATAGDPQHILDVTIRSGLEGFLQNQSDQSQIDAVQLSFDMFCDQSLEPTIRQTINNRFVLTMIGQCSTNAVLGFYEANVKRIAGLADSNYGIGSAGFRVEHALVNRIGAYQLFEMLFGAVDKERLENRHGGVGAVLLGAEQIKSGREIFRHVLTIAFRARTEIFITDDPTTREMFRRYQCAAYNAACAVVSNTQDLLAYYHQFLFKEKPAKNEFIWTKIIDCTADTLYTSGFDQEFDIYPQVKDRLVSIRKLKQQTDVRPSAKYLQSQTVFDSSLSQDVTKMDLSGSAVRTSADVATMPTIDAHRMVATVVHLEEIPVNNHECMSTLCATINHMIDSGISPIAENPQQRTRTAVEWVDCIASTIGDSTKHRNIRIFLVKLVLNCRSVLLHYAGMFVRPLLTFVNDRCAGDRLNYFNKDVIAQVIEWTTDTAYRLQSCDEKSTASAVLAFSMQNCWHDRKDIFRNNLEMIKLMMETWHEDIVMPKSFLIEAVKRTRLPNSKDNICGLQLNGVVLANDVVPWVDNASADQFVRSLFHSLDNHYMAVYRPASQLIGMCLAKIVLPTNNDDDEPLLVRDLNAILDKYRLRNENKFTDIIFGVHKHFPSIVDAFLVTLSNRIPLLAGPHRRIHLEMFLSRMDRYGTDLYRELLAIGIRDLLKQHEFQQHALHILNKALPFMSVPEMASLCDDVLSFVDAKRDCRDIMYEILMFIRDKATGIDPELMQKVSVALLNGLNDPDEEIATRLLKFWTDEHRLSGKLDARMLELLSKLYDPNTERNFLSYSVQLLLEPAIQNPDSKRQIFEHQTDAWIEMKLQEYDINVNWKTQNSTFKAPLFVESQQRELFTAGDGTAESLTNFNWLRASCSNLAFEPTQDPAMMSQTSENFSLRTQSAMLVSDPAQMLDRRSRRCGANQPITNVSVDRTTAFDKFRERFIRDKEERNRQHALRASDQHANTIAKLAEAKVQKERHVKLYRRYRVGDYPDLLINSLALLLPLVGLAKHDKILARQVIVSIFTAINVELAEYSSQFIVSASEFIQTIMTNSKYCEPLVFATLMEIALSNPKKFYLPPHIVSTFSNTSNMMAIGILYLENRIAADLFDASNTVETTSSCASKRSNSTITDEQQHWLKLGEMYRALGEHDIVAAIFAEKMPDVNANMATAIECELRNDYSSACSHYWNIINRECQVEQDFAYQSYYNCLAQMGDWTGLMESVERQIDSVEEIWTDDWNMENVLPHLMQTKLRDILAGESRSIDFLRELESWTQTPDRRQYIMLNFGEELMMFHIANQNYRQARVHSEERVRAFIAEWSHLNVLSSKVRSQKLLNIRNVAEMNSYAQMLLANMPYDRHESIGNLVVRWSQSKPNPCDSTLLWDTLIAYRTFVCTLINRMQNERQQTETVLINCIDDMSLTLLDLALTQQNIKLSDHIIQQLSPYDDQSMDARGLSFNIARSKHQTMKIDTKQLAGDQMHLLIPAWHRLEDEVLAHVDLLNGLPLVNIKALTQMAQTVMSIFDIWPNVHGALTKYRADIFHYASMSDNENIEHRLFEHARQCLRKSAEIAENHFEQQLNTSTKSQLIIGQTYDTLAQFCLDYNANERLADVPNMDDILVRSILRGMQYESPNAQQQFPLLLQLPDVDQATWKTVFKDESAHVPEWMFLGWIPQIISALNFTSQCYLDALFLRIAREYPAAVHNPFHLSFQQYRQSLIDSDAPNTNRKLIADTLAIVRNPLAEKFNEAMKQICVPETKLLYHLAKLRRKLNTDRQMTNQKWVNLVKAIVDTVYDSRHIFGAVSFGQLFDSVDHVKNLVKNLTSLDAIADASAILKAIDSIQAKLKAPRIADIQTSLQTMCQWLNQCQWFGDENYLELPGQYSGERKPIVSDHVKIMKFDEKTTVFPSLRKPVNITIYGSNGKSYGFLVKYGEDLRLDQRIQQLLQMMSRQLQNDRMCRLSNLSIKTYRVMAIDCHCGLLSWVDRTVAVQQIILKCLERHEPNAREKLNELINRYVLFLGAATKKRPVDKPEMYGNAAVHYTRMQIINNMQAITNEVPADILRFVLIDMSVSPESFFTLRNNFAVSLAAMSIAHWILGIGDRHLSNMLLNIDDASLVGIDFGIAFGGGTRDLRIPELVPFRLTPHFVSALNPLGVEGLLVRNMCHALRTFRHNRKLLMACMEIFIREPTIDWLETLRQNNANDNDRSMVSNWRPTERVKIVERKLSGANPRVLFETEIREGVVGDYSYVSGYIRLLKGDPMANIRSQLPDDKLTVEQQVKCLIEMATDPALLGISYEVFRPWI